MIRVLVADDNAVIRHGLVAMLATSDDFDVVGEAVNGRDALRLAEIHRPDVVLLDVRMPIMDGLAAASVLSATTKVLMLTYTDDADTVTAALRHGAVGYLVYGRFEPDELLRAVRSTACGNSVLSEVAASAVCRALRAEDAPSPAVLPTGGGWMLSDREAEVMGFIATGRSNAEIGAALFVSEKTVKNHVNRIYAKLAVRTRAEAVARWLGATGAHEPC